MNSWGIIGIGRIGLSMARNMSSKGITVSLYDKAYEKKTNLIFEEKELYSELNKASFFIDISSFIKSIEKPRKLLILVPAGEQTDHVINNLLDILDKNDIRFFDVQEGDLILFPSHLVHRAPVVKDDIIKTIISFNLDVGYPDKKGK